MNEWNFRRELDEIVPAVPNTDELMALVRVGAEPSQQEKTLKYFEADRGLGHQDPVSSGEMVIEIQPSFASYAKVGVAWLDRFDWFQLPAAQEAAIRAAVLVGDCAEASAVAHLIPAEVPKLSIDPLFPLPLVGGELDGTSYRVTVSGNSQHIEFRFIPRGILYRFWAREIYRLVALIQARSNNVALGVWLETWLQGV